MSVATAGAIVRTRILIVDDSAVIRGLITRTLDSEREFEVVASAADGLAAITAARQYKPDVIILDVEMPRMDGLTAIPQLLAVAPKVKIIMASTLTSRNADVTLQALAAGAVDYIPKPVAASEMLGPASFNRELVSKVRALSGRATKPRPAPAPTLAMVTPDRTTKQRGFALRALPIQRPRVVAIGTSTGGPQALFQVLKHLAPGPGVPIMITQHMPPTFTTILANHITRLCGIKAREASQGEVIEAGTAYVAPGDFHMLVERNGDGRPAICLQQTPAENFCRPSVDPMLRSLAKLYGPGVLSVILTGMGHDGLDGCRGIVEAGGSVIAQDETTSVVWGMPGAVSAAGICSAVLPIQDIGPYLRQVSRGTLSS